MPCHTILAPEAIHLSPSLQCHITQDGLTRIVELEAILWWVDVVSVFVSPVLQEVSWGLTAKAVVVGHETEEGECFGKKRRAETGIIADV